MTTFKPSRFQVRLRTVLIAAAITSCLLALVVTAYRHSTAPIVESACYAPIEEATRPSSPEQLPAQPMMLPNSIDDDNVEWDQIRPPGNLMSMLLETDGVIFSGFFASPFHKMQGHDKASHIRVTALGNDGCLVEYTGPRPPKPAGPPEQVWRLELTLRHLAQ